KSHPTHADPAELSLAAHRHRQAPLRFCAVLAQGATAAMSQTDAMLVGTSAMTHYAREAMHDVVENFTADGARDSQLIWRAWRNTHPFIVVGALWEAVAHLGIFPAQFFPPLETIAAAFARLSASRITLSTRSSASPPVSPCPRLLASRRMCWWRSRAELKNSCCRS